jgi:FXSXX-COOH protein
VDGATVTDETEPDWESNMIDVSGMSLLDLADSGDTVLTRCLRRLAADLDRPGEPIAGFNSAF